MPIAVRFEELLGAVTGSKDKAREEVLEELKGVSNKVVSSEDAIQDALESKFPGGDFLIHSEATRNRRKDLSDRAREIHHNLVVDNLFATRNTPSSLSREAAVLFKPETSAENIAHNQRLSNAITSKDYATQASILEEALNNLPPYNAADLMSLSDEQLVQKYQDLRSLVAMSAEAKNFLDKNPELMANLSGNAKEQLAQLDVDLDIFSGLKLRFEMICDPHYAIIDTEKVIALDTKGALTGIAPTALLSMEKREEMPAFSAFSTAIGSVSSYLPLLTQAKLTAELRGMGIDSNEVQYFNNDMIPHSTSGERHVPSPAEALNNGGPIFCRDKTGFVAAFRLEDGKLVQQDAALEMKVNIDITLGAELKYLSETAKGSVADPFWMLTGSSEYRDVKRSITSLEKLISSSGIPPKLEDYEKIGTILDNMEKVSNAYIAHKGVDPEEYKNIEEFTNADQESRGMSLRELTRMEAAFSARNLAQKLRTSLMLNQSIAMHSSKKDLMNDDQQVSMDNKAKSTAQANYGKALPIVLVNEKPLPGANNLRNDIYLSLYGNGGLLQNKTTSFTPKQQEVARDIMAKMVVYEMIKTGRTKDGTTLKPSPVEEFYNSNPDTLLKGIKMNMDQKVITPDALTKFVAENGQKAVAKDSLKFAAMPPKTNAHTKTTNLNMDHSKKGPNLINK